MNLPTQEQCLGYFEQYKVPMNIKEHCIFTQQIATFLAKKLVETGLVLDVELISVAALLHDLFKFAAIPDLKKNLIYRHLTYSEEELAIRKKLREKYPNMYENEIAYKVFKEEFPELALLIKRGSDPRLQDKNFIESLVHYADYRVKQNSVVSLRERFAYFKGTYPAPEGFWDAQEKYCQQIENNIFTHLSFKPEELAEVAR
jgi:hypothetical protein